MTKDQWIALGAVMLTAGALLGGGGAYLVEYIYEIGKRDQKAEGSQQLVVLQNSLSAVQGELKGSQTELEKAKAAAIKAESDMKAANQAMADKDALIAKYEKNVKLFNKCAVFEQGINDEKRKISMGPVSLFNSDTKEDRDKYRANAQLNLDHLYANLASANCVAD